MTPKLYRELRRIYLATREPTLGRLLLAHEQKKRPRSVAEVTQLSIRVVEVYCEPMQARLTVAECIRRQDAKTASGRGKGYPVHEACRPCPLRDVHRAMAPGFTPAPFRPFSIAKDRVQRAARSRMWKAGLLDDVRTMDESPNGEE